MSKPGHLVRGTAVNAAAAAVSTVLNLVLTSVLARNLSREQFGTWAFLMVLTFGQGYFSLLDAGMSVSALRDVVRLRHRGEDAAAADVLATLRAHFLLISLIGSVAIFAFGALLLEATGAEISGSTRTIVLLSLAVRLFTDSLHSSNMTLLESASAFGRMRALELTGLLVWTLSVTGILWQNGSLATLTFFYMLNGVLLLALSFTVSRGLEPHPLSYVRWSRDTASSLWKSGKWVAFQRLWAVIYAQMDRTILAVVLGVTLVGDYEIPYKFQAMGTLVLSVFPSAIFPVAARLNVSTDRDQLVRLFHRATRWTVGLSIPIMLTGIFLSGPLIHLWVGRSFQHLGGSVSLFLVWPVIASFHVVGSGILSGIGRTKELFVLASSSILVNLILSLSLARTMGINGVILGTVIGYSVVFVPYLRVELRYFGVGYSTWFRTVALPVLPAVGIQLPILMFIRIQWMEGWSSLLAVTCGGLSTFVGWAMFVMFEPDFRASGSLKRALSFGA